MPQTRRKDEPEMVEMGHWPGAGHGDTHPAGSTGKKMTEWELGGSPWTWGWNRDTAATSQDGRGGALPRCSCP